MITKAMLMAPALAAMLAGCTLIPDYRRGPLPVSQDYPALSPARPVATTGPAAGAGPAWDLGWRDFFTDPVLQDLLAFSLDNNRDLRVALLNVAAAQTQFQLAPDSQGALR